MPTRPPLESFITKPAGGGAKPPLSSFLKTPIEPASIVEPVPGEETAMIPAKPSIAPKGEAANLGEPLKILPNALKDIGVILKEGTFGTAKRVAYDIPKEAIGLAKEGGIKGAVEFAKALPTETINTLIGFIPQSAKELGDIETARKIPAEFQQLAKESGGYYEALKRVSKEIPGAVLPGLKQYTRQIDRARRAVVNHPVYETLGYLALKQVAENPAAFARQTKEGVKTTGEFLKHPVKSTAEVAADASRIFREKIAEPAQAKAEADLELAYRKQAGGLIKSRKQLARAEARGKDPVKVLAERGIRPEVEIKEGRSTISTKTGQTRIDTEVKPMNNHLDLALDEIQPGIQLTKLDDVRNVALRNTDKIYNITESARETIKNAINKEYDLAIEKYGPEVTLKQVNEIKQANWGETKFDITKPYQTDANYQIGKAAMQTVEKSVPKDAFGVHELNQEIGDLYEAKKLLSNMDGQIVRGGRLGRYFARIQGAIFGTMLPFPGGSIVGALGGDFISQTLQRRSFSPTMKSLFLRNLEKYDKSAYQQALQFIEKSQAERLTRKQLPAPTAIRLGPEQKPKIETGEPIITGGAKPPATYEEAFARQQAQARVKEATAATQAKVRGKVAEYRTIRKAAGQPLRGRPKTLETILPPQKTPAPKTAGRQTLRYTERIEQAQKPAIYGRGRIKKIKRYAK